MTATRTWNALWFIPVSEESKTVNVDVVEVTFDSVESPICAATADHEAGTSLAEASITPSDRELKWELMDNDIGVSWKTSDGNTTQEAVITESDNIVAVAGSEGGTVTARVCDAVLTSCTAATKELDVIDWRVSHVDTTKGNAGQVYYWSSGSIPSATFSGPGEEKTQNNLGPGDFSFSFSQLALTPIDSPTENHKYASDEYVLETDCGGKSMAFEVYDRRAKGSEVAVGKVFTGDGPITILVQHDHYQSFWDYDYMTPVAEGSKTIRLWDGGANIHTFPSEEIPTDIATWTEQHWIEDDDGNTVHSAEMSSVDYPTRPPQGDHFQSQEDSVNLFVNVRSQYTSYAKITSLTFKGPGGTWLWIPLIRTTDVSIQEE